VPPVDRPKPASPVDWRRLAKTVGIEAAVYAVLMTAYFFLVLHFMGGWLVNLFQHHRLWYAIGAVVLMFGQGVALEMLTTLLLKLVRRRTE